LAETRRTRGPDRCGALLWRRGADTASSVLSAVEALGVRSAAFDPYVIPISAGILIALFLLQRYGTAKVGALFGPIMMLWFFALAAAGFYGIVQHPEILGALSPLYALTFLTEHGFASFSQY
jgi:KUP system potassium uptake protein